MTAVAREGADGPLLDLLAHSAQLHEWADTLRRMGSEGRRLAVAHGPNREPEAERLARRFGAPTAPLGAVHRLRGSLTGRDLLIVLTPAAKRTSPIQSMQGLPALHDLLQAAVVIWGITGPRPNPLAPYCHDVIAVPTADPLLLLRGHRLVIRQLTRPAPAPSSLAVVRTGDRSS